MFSCHGQIITLQAMGRSQTMKPERCMKKSERDLFLIFPLPFFADFPCSQDKRVGILKKCRSLQYLFIKGEGGLIIIKIGYIICACP